MAKIYLLTKSLVYRIVIKYAYNSNDKLTHNYIKMIRDELYIIRI